MAQPYTVLKFTNISSKDFTHQYHGQSISVLAGESLLLPAEVADHLATHLARRILLDKADKNLMAKDEKLWDDGAIARLKEKILTEAYTKEPVSVPSEQERIAKEIADLNKDGPESVMDTEAANPESYQDKQAILDEYKAFGITPDPRKTKQQLINELADIKRNSTAVEPSPVSELAAELK